jgi:hypothetical protein
MDAQGYTLFDLSVDGNGDGVMAGLVELELLDIDDEIPREVKGIGRELDLEGDVDSWHDRLPVCIHQVDTEPVRAFVGSVADNPQRDGALGVFSGELAGHDGIEGSEQAQLTPVIGSRVTESGDLEVHLGSDLNN